MPTLRCGHEARSKPLIAVLPPMNTQVNSEAPRPTRPFLDHTLSGVPPSPSLKRRLRRKRFKPRVVGGA